MNSDPLTIWNGIDAHEAETCLLGLKRRQIELDMALQSQWQIQKIHPDSFAVSLAGKSLEARRQQLASELSALLKYRVNEPVQITLDGREFHEHSAGIGTLSVFLLRLQKLYTAVAQAIQTGPTLRGPIANVIRDATELRMVGVFPSSFGMDLYVPSKLDLMGHSVSSNALAKMFELLSSSVDEKRIMELSGALGGRATNHLRHLAAYLSASESSLSVSWSDYTGTKHEWIASQEVASRITSNLQNIIQISSSRKNYTGLLGGGSIFRNSFELLDQKTDLFIEGSMVSGLTSSMKDFFGTVCVVTVDETEVLDRASGDKKLYYVLTDINDVNKSALEALETI